MPIVIQLDILDQFSLVISFSFPMSIVSQRDSKPYLWYMLYLWYMHHEKTKTWHHLRCYNF